jgi:hypothetical protein
MTSGARGMQGRPQQGHTCYQGAEQQPVDCCSCRAGILIAAGTVRRCKETPLVSPDTLYTRSAASGH